MILDKLPPLDLSRLGRWSPQTVHVMAEAMRRAYHDRARVDALDFDMDIRAAVDASRQHHQWFPDKLRLERASAQAELVRRLRQMGHVVEDTRQGDVHSIWVDPRTGLYHGAEDRRIRGKLACY